MKFLIWMISLVVSVKAFAIAQACTVVCPVALSRCLAIAGKLGVPNEVIGVLFGALLAVLGYWLIQFFEKRNWNFPGRNVILMLLSLASVAFVYDNTSLTYEAKHYLYFLNIDSFLLATILGALTHIAGVHLYAWMKAKNGGHAHFPFEKVVVPIVLDLVMCALFWQTPIFKCQDPIDTLADSDTYSESTTPEQKTRLDPLRDSAN